MVQIANSAMAGRASMQDAGGKPALEAAALPGRDAFAPLTALSTSQWRALAERAIEPNGYYLPDWELAVNASARGRTGVSALSAWGDASLTQDGAARLVAQARNAGAHALILRDVSLDGAVMTAFAAVLRQAGMHPLVLHSRLRACLDATREADQLLREALDGKKLKELRRQRHRLAEHGAVRFEVARTPDEVAPALEIFLRLEASGWKGQRGTALIQDQGDAGFIRRAAPALAETRQCEIVTLRAGDTPVASAIVLRHGTRAFYFKLGIDERFAKFSPGVQLTLDLTRHLCADPAIASADSTAGADHPMINPIWRGRFAIGDVLIPLRRNDPVVRLIHTALTLRRLAREQARRAVRLVRGR